MSGGGVRPAFLAALALAAGEGSTLKAQFFQPAQNKIQYRQLEWQILKGPRVDVYYYPAEAELAPVALAWAEESCDTLTLRFGHVVRERIPLIVYASHADFEQTNVLPFTPPEGLLGVTDFLKGRVTMPFRGNLTEFRHTLRHELVHVYQLSLLNDRFLRVPNAPGLAIPLWWTEGLAELWSGGEDARDEMVLRDLVLDGRLPGLQELGFVSGGIVYPLGGRIHRWLAEAYGDWRVAELYRNLWRHASFEEAVVASYGRSLEQLNEEFQVAMRRAYYPTAVGRTTLPEAGVLLARGAVKPTYARGPDGEGEEAIYASGAGGLISLRTKPLDGGEASTIVKSGRTASLENFHVFDSRVDASRTGLLLFSSRVHDRDALMIYDRRRRRMVGRYQFPSLVSILSPVWGPEGRSVIFSGLAESGISDLYQVSLPDGRLRRVTDDRYQDLDPSLSPDGTRVVFASDRTAGGLDGAVNLFVLDLETGTIRQLTSGPWVDETPAWVEPDRITFSSGRDGVLNVFSVDTLGAGRRETAVWTGAFDAATAGDRGALLVSGFHDLTLGVYLYPADSSAQEQTFTAEEAPAPHSAWGWPEGRAGTAEAAPPQPYRRRYTLDFAAGQFVYVPRAGSGQGAVLLLSDLLSDNVLLLSLSTYQGREFRSVLENVSALGLYINQTRRLNWGVGAFRFTGNQYVGDFTPAYTETSAGAFGLLRYPLSRFTRIEGQAAVQHSDRVDFTLPVDQPRRVGWLVTQSVSYVHDNALWTSTGPIDGHTLTLSSGVTSDLSNARFDGYTIAGDARQYFRLSGRSALALRAFGFLSGGDRPDRVNIGGTLGLRGYPNYGYVLGTRAWMGNAELRFPLLDYLLLGSPAGPVRFPEFQGALFADVGRSWVLPEERRAILGSYGVSFRWPAVPGLVLRLDWGRRWSDAGFRGYGLMPEQTRRSFAQFFFGYNY